MSWLTAEPEDMSHASSAAADAATTASGMNMSQMLAPITRGLPGSRSAAMAGFLADAWQERLAVWSGRADQYATGLRRLSGDYVVADETAASELGTSPRLAV